VSVEAVVARMDGDAALPRRNGELVFEAPWESRAFGMVLALHEGGAFDWDDFRDRLIAEIGAQPEDDGTQYYERWLAAFERLLGERGVLEDAEVAARVREIADHEHDHEHPHDH
jgi:nitrile hydratase accessory protein